MPPSERSTSVRVQNCIDRLLAGDPSARDDLITEAYNRLLFLTKTISYPFKNVKQLEDTTEIAHTAMVKLLKSLDTRTPPTTRQFFAFATVVIRNVLLDEARKVRRILHTFGQNCNGQHDPDLPTLDFADPSVDFKKIQERLEIYEQLEKLPEEERQILELYHFWGLSREEIGKVLDMPLAQVRRHLRNAKLRLHQWLRPDTSDSER